MSLAMPRGRLGVRMWIMLLRVFIPMELLCAIFHLKTPRVLYLPRLIDSTMHHVSSRQGIARRVTVSLNNG